MRRKGGGRDGGEGGGGRGKGEGGGGGRGGEVRGGGHQLEEGYVVYAPETVILINLIKCKNCLLLVTLVSSPKKDAVLMFMSTFVGVRESM